MQHLINSPRRAYQFRIVVLFIAIALAGSVLHLPQTVVARPIVLQQEVPGYYWGSDTNQYKTNPDTPLYFPSQDFYIGQLGSGLGAPGTGTQGFTLSGAPAQGTYAYWTLLGPNPQSGAGKGGMTNSEWGRAQAQQFITAVTTGPFSNTIKGNVLFADIEGPLDGSSSGTWLSDSDAVNMPAKQAANMEVVNSFLNEIASSQTFVPGIYTAPGFWGPHGSNYDIYYFGQNPKTDVPFVLWISHWLSTSYYPTEPEFPSLIPEVVAMANDTYLLESIAGYYPVVWQFGGDAGDLAIQNPSQGFRPKVAARPTFNEFTFGPNDDGTYPCASNSGCTPQAQDLGFNINFLGTSYRYVYVNNNGNLTFDSPLATYTPFGLAGTNHVIIAPFFADVDTRIGPAVTFGRGTVNGHQAFGVNWPGVGCYSQIITVRNGFQVVLIERADRGNGDFDIEFNYDQIQWDTGQASGGNTNCLGANSARVGYSNGSTQYYELQGSGVPGALLDSGPFSLIQRSQPSSLQRGRFVFEVKNGATPSSGAISGLIQNATSAPLDGAFVQACNEASGTCNTTNTTASGQYAIEGLSAGQYRVTAYSPGGTNLLPGTLASVTVTSDSTVSNQNISLPNPLPLPVNTQITSRAAGNGGIPIVYWRADLTLSTSGCSDGTASYQILQDGAAIRSGTLAQTTPGLYTGTIPALYPAHGYATVSTQLLCPGAAAQNGVFDIYIDPSGVVRDTSGTPLSSAIVTLYRSDNASGPFAAVPQASGLMSVVNRNNPSTTDVNGLFGWDVLAGFYKVRAEKAGCVMPNDPTQPFVESAVLTIPPAVTDLDLRLNCDTIGTLTLTSIADARVKEISPTVNFGTSSRLDADGSSGRVVQSYLRFNVSGLSGPVQRAVLRLKATSNGTINGPQVFSTSNAWEETTVTWSNRPAPVGSILGNAGVISPNTWIEYDVTALIAGNGTYNLMLIPDNSDGVEFSSRQGDALPELVLTLAQSSMPVPRPFGAVADARVKQESPTANYGTSTMLDADGSSGDVVQSYLRFNVSGLARPVQRAVLRVKSLSNGTVNGPQVFSTSNAWEETAVTWNNHPAPEGTALGNADAIGPNTWVEYDVTALVTGNGTYNFVLIPDHSDGVEFSSRQGDAMPQLLITLVP